MLELMQRLKIRTGKNGDSIRDSLTFASEKQQRNDEQTDVLAPAAVSRNGTRRLTSNIQYLLYIAPLLTVIISVILIITA